MFSSHSRAGYPQGAAEIFSLMQHMGCEPDRASYNIMVDAYGRAGLHEGMVESICILCKFPLFLTECDFSFFWEKYIRCTDRF